MRSYMTQGHPIRKKGAELEILVEIVGCWPDMCSLIATAKVARIPGEAHPYAEVYTLIQTYHVIIYTKYFEV